MCNLATYIYILYKIQIKCAILHRVHNLYFAVNVTIICILRNSYFKRTVNCELRIIFEENMLKDVKDY